MGILNKIDFKEIDLTKETINYKKMEKLTLQDCFKYPNARIKFKRDNEQWIDVHSFIYDYYSIGEPTFSIEDCKIQLRPLSSLTVEEKKIIWAIENTTIEIKKEKSVVVLNMRNVETSDYLRSINIDIDNLQEKGVAVYE